MSDSRLRRAIFGAPRDIKDPRTYHNVSLIALLAWVGLGADGLSSSAYGPDELYRAIGDLHFLAPALALATAGTVLLISVAYSRIIEHFPFGGGGYVVATRLLGSGAGLVSGSALLVDYVLTISVSIAAGGDAIWSFLPPHLAAWKVPAEGAAIVLLVVMNLRGVKESVSVLAPIFGIFLVTHAILIFGGVGSHLGEAPAIATELVQQGRTAVGTMGWTAIAGVFIYAYSMGAGTYTGIEAVSNGLQIMREPRVATAKRTMAYMAISLSVTAGGILLAYLLFRVAPVEGKTMNAVLLENFAGQLERGRVAGGALVRHRDARHLGRAPLRGGAGRLPRRAAGHGQHGHRQLDAPPVRVPLRPAGHAVGCAAHGRGEPGHAGSSPAVTWTSSSPCTRSTSS